MPEIKKRNPRQRTTRDDEEKLSRRKKKEASGDYIPMPPIEHGGHIVMYLFEVGPGIPGAMGYIPLSHVEVNSWQSNMGYRLEPWEIRWLMRLSSEYVNQSHEAKDEGCPAPWIPPKELRPMLAPPSRESAERNKR